MKVFDSQKKAKWNCRGRIIEAPFKLGRGDLVESRFSAKSVSKVKVIGKRVSGDGIISVALKDSSGKVVFSDKIKLSKGSSSEASILCALGPVEGMLTIEKPTTSPGSVTVDRVIVEGSSSLRRPPDGALKEKVDYKAITDNIIKNIKLAIIVPYGIYGGGEVYLKNMIKHGREGFDIDVLFLAKNKLMDELIDSPVGVVRMGGLSGLKSRLRGDRYDSIVFYNSKKVYEELIRKKEYEGLSASLVEIYHSDFRWSDSLSSIKSRRYVDKIFRVAEGLAKDVSGVDEADKVCIPVSIEGTRFDKVFKRPPEIPKTKKISIGLVARLSPEKNINYALSLAKEIPEYDFYIVGDGPLKRSLIERRDKEFIENVKFLGYKRDVDRYYSVFDALMLVSKIEGTPISIAEGLLCGLPIFTTPVGQIEELYSELSGVVMLTGSPNDDARILREFEYDDFDGAENINFAKTKHNLKRNRELFFSSLLSPLSLKIPAKDMTVLPGEYL